MTMLPPNQAPEQRLPEPEMPTLSRALSANARHFQAVARWTVGGALFFIGISAIASVFHNVVGEATFSTIRVNIATGIAALFFLAAGGIRLYRIARRPEQIWYGSRTLRERTQSLGWRYAVAGAPFPLTGDGPAATDTEFQEQLDAAAKEATASGIRIRKPQPNEAMKVFTDWMRETRAELLAPRRVIYAAQRIGVQQQFYEKRERTYERSAALAQVVLVVIEFGGAALAALNAVGALRLDLIGVAGTVAAGVAAWVQFNQFTALAGTYGAMAYRMEGYRERCLREDEPWTEVRWASFVGQVEDDLAAESSTWKQIVRRDDGGLT